MQERMAAMQEAMKRPEVQQQMQQMMAMSQNTQLQERMKALKDDPEMAPIFEEIQKVGPCWWGRCRLLCCHSSAPHCTSTAVLRRPACFHC